VFSSGKDKEAHINTHCRCTNSFACLLSALACFFIKSQWRLLSENVSKPTLAEERTAAAASR